MSLRGRKEAEKELAVSIEALSAIPTTERESPIAEALAQIAEQERRKSLLDKANKMSTEELKRRLEYLKRSAGAWTVRNCVSDGLR